MIFKKLQLENFQAHANTAIEFTDTLNIIVGPSDTGKSSIIRALRKLVRDDPPGKPFIRHSKTDCTITLVINKGGIEYKIIRKITPSKNLYYIDSHEFGGFGREIPQEIQDLLEMSLIELENNDKIDLHFVDQHDSPFMVARGAAGTRSKLLGHIGGLHVLDNAIIHVNKDIRAGNSKLKEKVVSKDTLQQKINSFPDLKAPEKLLKRLQTDLDEIKSQKVLKERLEKEQALLNDVIVKGKQIKQLYDRLPNIQVDFNTLYKAQQRLTTLYNLQQSLQDVNMRIDKLKKTIPSEITIDFDCIKNKMILLKELQMLQGKYKNLCVQINTTEKYQDKCVSDLEQSQQAWVNMLQTLGKCPTCKQSTKSIKKFHG